MRFVFAAMLAVAVAATGCGDDTTSAAGSGGTAGTGGSGTAGSGGSGTAGTGGTAGGPDCTQELCMANETLMANCLREYDECIALGESTEEQCRIFAEETCTI